MVTQTGVYGLDEMLAGGLPTNRATLAIGGPGTGKSTLAMQFLQTGLEAGDECLFISTEQTAGELRDSFADFSFDLDHDHLTLTTVHAAPGETLDGEEELTIKTLEGGEILETGFGIPFTSHRLVDVLDQYAPVDRVVLDSASGLGALGDDREFRRAILDLIRLFSDEFEATSLLTAEGRPDAEDRLDGHEFLQFTTHGVIRIWRERVAGSEHRFIRVPKMRGVDHDERRYSISIGTEGVRVVPRRRTRPPSLVDYEYRPTGIEGVDDLLGGGLIEGETTVVFHDGSADTYMLLTRMMAAALSDDWTISIVPPAELTLDHLDQFWAEDPLTVEEMLDEDRLIVEEFVRVPDDSHENVFVYEEYKDIDAYLRAVYGKTRGRNYAAFVDFESVLQRLSEDDLREAIYQVSTGLMTDVHIPIYICNPHTVTNEFSSFLRDAATQVLHHRQDEDGLEYLSLDKSPSGAPGTTSIVEYTEEYPFVRLPE